MKMHLGERLSKTTQQSSRTWWRFNDWNETCRSDATNNENAATFQRLLVAAPFLRHCEDTYVDTVYERRPSGARGRSISLSSLRGHRVAATPRHSTIPTSPSRDRLHGGDRQCQFTMVVRRRRMWLVLRGVACEVRALSARAAFAA